MERKLRFYYQKGAHKRPIKAYFRRQYIFGRGLGASLIIATFWKYLLCPRTARADAACVVGFCDGGCAWSSESPKGWRTQI